MDKQQKEIMDNWIIRNKGAGHGAATYRINGVEFTEEQRIQRARELGWINGYKWGVEYQTNGVKPDLPDDVVFEMRPNFSAMWSYPVTMSRVSDARWRDEIVQFRIIDERYKPVERPPEAMPVSAEMEAKIARASVNWYDYDKQKAIALPPVGAECEYQSQVTKAWRQGKVIAKDDDSELMWFEGEGLVYAYHKHFRPLDHATRKADTERKRFVDFVTDLLYKHCCATKGELRDGAEKLFELGFKLPEDK